MSDAASPPQGVSEPSASSPKAPSIGMVMLEWALNVVVGFFLIGTIVAVATYFMVGPNDKQLAIPLGIFVGFTLGAVIGAKTKIIRILK